jgi:hypothetical protein
LRQTTKEEQNGKALARTVDVHYFEGQGLTLSLDVNFSGPDVPDGNMNIPVYVYLSPGDQPAAIRTKMSAAVSATAVDNGFTCPGGGQTLPTFQKG